VSTVLRPAPGAAAPLRRAHRRWGERAIEVVLFLAALVSVLTTVGIVVAILSPTIAFFAEPAVTVWGFLTGTEWSPLFAESQRSFGVLPLVTATVTTYPKSRAAPAVKAGRMPRLSLATMYEPPPCG
jgi:phosphate transport system permease protein